MIYFWVKFISFVKRKAKSTIKQQKCKGHKKRDRLKFWKWNSIFIFTSGIKNCPTDPVFWSKLVLFHQKISIINCSWNSNSCKVIFTFPGNSKAEIKKKQVRFFFLFYLPSLTLYCWLCFWVSAQVLSVLIPLCNFYFDAQLGFNWLSWRVFLEETLCKTKSKQRWKIRLLFFLICFFFCSSRFSYLISRLFCNALFVLHCKMCEALFRRSLENCSFLCVLESFI